MSPPTVCWWYCRCPCCYLYACHTEKKKSACEFRSLFFYFCQHRCRCRCWCLSFSLSYCCCCPPFVSLARSVQYNSSMFILRESRHDRPSVYKTSKSVAFVCVGSRTTISDSFHYSLTLPVISKQTHKRESIHRVRSYFLVFFFLSLSFFFGLIVVVVVVVSGALFGCIH